MQKMVFDVGMYDGADSEYYLHKGFKVVAIEANPDLAGLAREKFSGAIAAGRLIVENVAVARSRGPLQLCLPKHDLGSSTILDGRYDGVPGARSVTVMGVRFADLLEKHGVPHYLKVDIEGCDDVCIRSLGRKSRPAYVSFEMGDDAMDLARHLNEIGYSQFKIISQTSFKQLNQHGLSFRAQRKLKKVLGLSDAPRFECDDWSFAFGHSSGPMAEATSGSWQSFDEMRDDWLGYQERSTYDIGGWFDLHAKLPS